MSYLTETKRFLVRPRSEVLSISLPFGNVGMASRTVNEVYDGVNGFNLGFYFAPDAECERKDTVNHSLYEFHAWEDL